MLAKLNNFGVVERPSPQPSLADLADLVLGVYVRATETKLTSEGFAL